MQQCVDVVSLPGQFLTPLFLARVNCFTMKNIPLSAFTRKEFIESYLKSINIVQRHFGATGGEKFYEKHDKF